MEHATLLASIPLFESLTPADAKALASQLDERKCKKDEVIFHQGEPGDTLYIIHEGAVDICHGEGKAKVDLVTLSNGQYFGELSLFDGGPRSATATARRDTTLLVLPRNDFQVFLEKTPKAGAAILAELASRLRQTNELMARQVSRNVLEEADERLSLGERVADQVAAFGGSWPFIGVFAVIMAVWMMWNVMRHENGFDPYPFILLNLVLSTLAALQAPVIMMSQNRQAAKDKLLSQNDYLVNLKSEIGIDKLLKGQSELLARVAVLERVTGPR
jgi:CRP/FNR family transcriptional regulator, cyclic AMP receptor protein